MTELILSELQGQKGRGGVGLFFHWDAFDIERMVGEKMICSSFGGVASPWMRTLDAGAGKH
jgi:hypothetical protein